MKESAMNSRGIGRRWPLALIILMLLCNVMPVGEVRASPPDAALELPLPLDRGRLNVRDVVARIFDELGIKPGDSLKNLDWSIDVQSALGRMQLHLFDRLAGGVISTRVEADRVVVQVDRAALKAKLAASGRTAERWLLDLTGGAQNHQARAYGLTFITSAGANVPVDVLSAPPKRAVILVHGLDDPGFMWRDLMPALQNAGYFVGRFEYPNDGPIAESADLLALALSEARRAGIEHVDIVAHSMGGLVARDVLTRPAYYHGDGAGGDHYVSIDRLIMAGTPNHGSELARLREVTEIGEHLYRAWTGQTQAPSAIGDGSGEAGIDLLPDSEFLRRLNDRPLATHTRHTIIAGQWSPVGAGEVNSLIDKTRDLANSQNSPAWLREWMSERNQKLAVAMLSSAVNGLGDGCVTLESAKLIGVDDFTIVPANHISMLINGFTSSSKVQPPAIAIILDRLAKADQLSEPDRR